jgi:DegV family protein with EDD domain
MAGVAVVTDSLACLPRCLTEENGVVVVPINIRFRDRVYRDCVDLTPSEAYCLFREDPEAFGTTPATPAQYIEAFRESLQHGEDVLCITVSSKLSTGYNVARVAADTLARESSLPRVSVLDSGTVLAAQGFVVLSAARKAALGRDLSEVMEAVEDMKRRACFALVLETIRHVYRTGRVPRVAARAASVLSIKPILSCASGVVHLIGVARNMHQGVERIIRTMTSRAGAAPLHIAIMHAYAPDEAEKLKEKVAAEVNCAELWVTEVSPVVGYALGAGALGLAYYAE